VAGRPSAPIFSVRHRLSPGEEEEEDDDEDDEDGAGDQVLLTHAFSTIALTTPSESEEQTMREEQQAKQIADDEAIRQKILARNRKREREKPPAPTIRVGDRLTWWADMGGEKVEVSGDVWGVPGTLGGLYECDNLSHLNCFPPTDPALLGYIRKGQSQFTYRFVDCKFIPGKTPLPKRTPEQTAFTSRAQKACDTIKKANPGFVDLVENVFEVIIIIIIIIISIIIIIYTHSFIYIYIYIL
jgi:hypothetical protein